MTYQLLLSEGAREQLKALPKPARRRIGLSLTRLQTDLDGNVKKLVRETTREICGKPFNGMGARH